MIFSDKQIIAITGSAGKTTVKSLTAEILRKRWQVFEPNHYNNTYQKTEEHATKITEEHDAAVLEYGMAFAGAITKHCEHISPNIAVITNVGLAHIGNFDNDIRKLAAAKSEMILGMQQDGRLYLSGDDVNSMLLNTGDFAGEIKTVGFINPADFRAENIQLLKNGISFMLELKGQRHKFYLPLFGIHNVYNALFAIAICYDLGFTPLEISDALKTTKTAEHRLDVLTLKNNIKIIDDTVHSNPVALKAAIDVLDEIGEGQKIVVLGSMSELGDKQTEYHKDIGRYLADRDIDFIFTHGNISVDIGVGAISAGYPADRVSHKTRLKRNELLAELKECIKPGATVLVKGFSRLKMYEIVKNLSKEYKV